MVCHYAETRNLFIAMPNAITLSVFWLNVVMLNVIMLIVVAPKELRPNVGKMYQSMRVNIRSHSFY